MRWIALAALSLLPAGAHAQEEPSSADLKRPPIAARSTHQMHFGGQPLNYEAVVETTVLRDAAGEPEAEFVTTAYIATNGDRNTRPVLFAFNGGPGSSSLWLHMGFVGPRRVLVPSDAQAAGAPPYSIVDNQQSLLELCDLIFIDPIGTGFSRVVGAGKNEQHWGVQEDARSVARFIQRWVTEHDRWASPKYVLGESYGGIRGPLVARELQSGAIGMALNGLILISPALDMALVDGRETDATYATVLPTYAAVAWYHEALNPRPTELAPFLHEVRRFAETEYLPALFLGDALEPARREQLVAKMARYTGLDREYIERANLRVSVARFRAELLRRRGLTLGRLDARYTGREADGISEAPSDDPFSTGVGGAFAAALQVQMKRLLQDSPERDYALRADFGGHVWKRPDALNGAFAGFLNVGPVLTQVMEDNPHLRLFVCSGLYDFATTFYAAEVNLRRAHLPQDRVVVRDYPAGHMMYLNEESSAGLAEDLRSFLSATPKSR